MGGLEQQMQAEGVYLVISDDVVDRRAIILLMITEPFRIKFDALISF